MESESATATPGAPQGLRPTVRVRLFLIGIAAGLVNGLLSIGGGILIVPGLIFLRNVSVRVATSTSLAAVLLMSIVAMAVHIYISGFSMSLEGSAVLILAGMVSAQLGGWLLNHVPQRWIFFAFAAMALLSAAHLLSVAFALAPPISRGEPALWSYLLIGGLSGVISGLLGVGGGGIAVMGFSIGFHTPVLGGLPMALALNVCNSLSGVLVQARKGNILWSDVFRLFPASLAGIAAGVALAVWLSPDSLRIAFALFFVFIGAMMCKRGWRK